MNQAFWDPDRQWQLPVRCANEECAQVYRVLDARRALQLYTVRRLLFRLVSTLLCLLANKLVYLCLV
jgi:hypothetical protein